MADISVEAQLKEAEAEAAREVAALADTSEPMEDEDADWEDVAEQSEQPIRMPAVSADLSRTLSKTPRRFAAAAMRMMGRIAAGDAAAFADDKHLRHNPKYRRARPAGDYRLVYYTEGETVHFVDLVHRRQLARFVRRLPPG